ncbi:putative CDC42 small effector protein [Naja naja]|nr:putative CDC42 small effector protein [Naja naja]
MNPPASGSPPAEGLQCPEPARVGSSRSGSKDGCGLNHRGGWGGGAVFLGLPVEILRSVSSSFDQRQQEGGGAEPSRASFSHAEETFHVGLLGALGGEGGTAEGEGTVPGPPGGQGRGGCRVSKESSRRDPWGISFPEVAHRQQTYIAAAAPVAFPACRGVQFLLLFLTLPEVVFFNHLNRSPRHLKVSPGSKLPRTPHGWLSCTLRASGISGWTRGPNHLPASPWHPPGRKLEVTLTMSDFWHKLGCCVVEKAQPQRKRRRIDRSMIGEPMNFVHLTHIGSGDMVNEGLPAVANELQK